MNAETKPSENVNFEALEKIVNHLRYGQLGHSKFDFNIVHRDSPDPDDIMGYGSAGCVIGEFPFIFPEKYTQKQIFDRHISHQVDGIMSYLGISYNDFYYLFYPHGSFRCDNLLSEFATKEQVADNIEKFIKIKKEELNG